MGFYDINKLGGMMPFGGASLTGMSPSMPSGLSFGTPAASTNFLSQPSALDSFSASPWGGFNTASPFVQTNAAGFDMSSLTGATSAQPFTGLNMPNLAGVSSTQPLAGIDMSNLTGASTMQPFAGMTMPIASTPVGLTSYTPPIPAIGQTGTANTPLTGFTPSIGTETGLPITGTSVPVSGTTVPANGTPTTSSTMDTAAAMQAFEGYGWSPAQAAGIVANLQKSGGPDQWSADRQANYATFAKANGLQNTDAKNATPAEQYAFINYELTQGDKKSTGTALKAAKTPQDAAKIFAQGYGIPAGMQDDSELEDIASQLFAGLGNTDEPMPLGLDTPTGGNGDPTGGNMTPTSYSPTGGTGGSGGSGGSGDDPGGGSDPGGTEGVNNFQVNTAANLTDAQNKIVDQVAKDEDKKEWSWSNATNNGVEGCAASVSAVLNEAGVLDHKMTAININTEADQLEKNGFVKLKPGEKPQPGDVWIGRGGASSGHTGIIGKDGKEYANSSSTGKWTGHTKGSYFSKWNNNVFYRKVK